MTRVEFVLRLLLVFALLQLMAFLTAIPPWVWSAFILGGHTVNNYVEHMVFAILDLLIFLAAWMCALHNWESLWRLSK
jgi:hypothetical protein